MWDNVNNKLVSTIGGNWDSTTYPIAQYEPIAINIYPSNQASDGKSRYMALRWASNTSDTGSTSNFGLAWGNEGDNLTSKDQTALNGRDNTDKALALADGTTANTQAAFASFAAVNRFRTNGTNQGDWYLPSKGELSLYQSNYDDINAKIQAIKNASSSIVDTVNGIQWSSTESETNFSSWELGNNGSFSSYSSRGNSYGVRGMIAL